MTLRHGQFSTDWADGTYTFRLGLAELEELERRFDRSIFVIATRLGERQATSSEIREVLRIGLIGGGETSAADALALVRRYVDERPLEESRDVAYAIALASLLRLSPEEIETSEQERPGEADAAEAKRPGASTSPRSGAPLQ